MNLLVSLLSKKSVWIIAAFVVCYAVSATVFQSVPSPLPVEFTVFASLMYLPHGVVVLAIMLFGWKALPALIAGNLLGDLMFKPELCPKVGDGLKRAAYHGGVERRRHSQRERICHHDQIYCCTVRTAIGIFT